MIVVEVGSLTEIDCEAVVRSVNAELDPVTAVDRNLGAAAGNEVLEQLAGMGSFPVGGAVITSGGQGRALFLIHVVVTSGEEPITTGGVRRALLNGLRRALHFGVQSMAISPLGTGAGNLDADESARAMVEALIECEHESGLPGSIRIVVPSDYEMAEFESRLRTVGLME